MIRPLLFAAALALPVSACTDSQDEPPAPPIAQESDSETEARGFGGPIRGELLAAEANAGDEIEVGVTDEVVFLRLTDATRKEAREQMDQEVPEDGLGGAIGRAVTGFVNEALESTVQIPLPDVDDLRYEDGRLFLDADDDEINVQFDDEGSEGIPFDAAAAERLIDAFDRAK